MIQSETKHIEEESSRNPNNVKRSMTTISNEKKNFGLKLTNKSEKQEEQRVPKLINNLAKLSR